MFYTEIQDGRQKWQEIDFWEKSPADYCSISHHFRDKCIFVFYVEIQDGRQKWQEIDFWEKSPADCNNTLGVKNFDEITLSCTKFKMAAEMAGN